MAVPDGLVGSSGPEAAELAAACGLVLDDWQRLTLELALGERVDGSWAAADVGLIASRQNGKNGVVEARELFGLSVLDEWIIHTSHLFKTTRESYNRLLSMIDAHPDVRNLLVSHVASPASGYEMRFRGGGRITFIARSRSSGRGLTGDLLVFDEAQDLSDDAQGALLPTISARPGSQAWYLGSAPQIDSVVFHRVRKRGRAGGDGRLAYLEFSALPDADLDDRDEWARANPALGTRITEEAIESERAVLAPDRFAAERLSISPDPPDAASVFPGSSWAEVRDRDAVATVAKVFAVDVSLDRSSAAIVVGGGGVVEVVDYRPGTEWLVGRCVELHARHKVAVALDKRGPVGAFVEELKRVNVPVIELDSLDMTRACGSFYDRVAARTIRVRQHADLDRAVAGAAKRAVGDAWIWGRKSSSDISLLVAATVAAWVAEERAVKADFFTI